MTTDHFNWTTAPAWMPDAALYADASTETDRLEIGFYIDYFGDEYNAAFWINHNGEWFSTTDPSDWPDVARYIPYEEWPVEVDAGFKRRGLPRTPDKAVLKAIEDFKKAYAETLAADQTDDLDD